MTTINRWLLPEGIEEILPPKAMQIEYLCRELVDLLSSWGYEFVIPPMLEYLESLLTGTGEDLDLKTFKLTDQLSGRLMGSPIGPVRIPATSRGSKSLERRSWRDIAR